MRTMIVDRTINRLRVFAECGSAYATMAESVLSVFESRAGSLGPGFHVRFGWSLLGLVQDGNALRIAEPDFVRWPALHWFPTIDRTLKVATDQVRLLRRFGIDGEDAFFDQLIITASDALDKSRVFLRRDTSASAEDSGWLLGTPEDPEALTRDEIESVWIASLVARRPELLPVLTLPYGFIALFVDDSLEQVFDPSGKGLL